VADRGRDPFAAYRDDLLDRLAAQSPVPAERRLGPPSTRTVPSYTDGDRARWRLVERKAIRLMRTLMLADMEVRNHIASTPGAAGPIGGQTRNGQCPAEG
jgi:hypothetical protein